MASAKKLPSGKWRVLLFVGKDENNKRKYRSFTADTKKEAEFLAAQYNQLHIEANRSEQTLREAAERYIKSKENILSASTIRGYYAVLKNYLSGLFAVKIKDITAETIQIAFNDFAKSYSAKTCRNAHGLVSIVLKIERPDLRLKTTLPQKDKHDIYVPDEQEIKEILMFTAGTNIEIPFILATQCGLRASEISGLDKSCVFEDHIEIKCARVDGLDGAVLKKPKSFSGFRSIPISKEIYDILISKANGERICPMTSTSISSAWGKFREKHGIDTRCNFHALRHHFASRCLLLGIPQKYIAELMGHSSLDMIEKVYQHIFPSAMEEFAELIRRKDSELMQHKMQHKNK
ncbi:MAG: site-specific integrase [Oscillospiraceae bacterium]|nr:site-specific integrase [Oscillospiraceae bacterium]